MFRTLWKVLQYMPGKLQGRSIYCRGVQQDIEKPYSESTVGITVHSRLRFTSQPIFCSNLFSVKVFQDVLNARWIKFKQAALLFLIVYDHVTMVWQSSIIIAVYWMQLWQMLSWNAEIILSPVRKDLTAEQNIHYRKNCSQVHLFIRSLKVLQLAAWTDVLLSVINTHAHKNTQQMHLNAFKMPFWFKCIKQRYAKEKCSNAREQSILHSQSEMHIHHFVTKKRKIPWVRSNSNPVKKNCIFHF